ncbi:SAM-dependent methyltransferase [Nostoc parmelioides]|uniref:Class I SAM-dependent methyltransferase n=1 Tax=Nostoc parmelioides FACHB-3921 TaxID=2692909 RepID=A0ABR8BN02_9NOSO|nr:class I SAM-dependent methyltransferase [Nostoc parmelioides]MBD2254617.1 class I SAM-dependent methyltransferase [Nostoc parmelioides FACHB-3921]
MTSKAKGKQPDPSQNLRKYVNNHIRSNTILAVLGATLNARVTGTPLQPKIQVQIDEVIDALGIGDMVEETSTAILRQIIADIRFNMLLDAKLFSRANDGLVWTHDETDILQAGGEVSAGFAEVLTHKIAPSLDGLSQRLGSPNGSFLDVGVGTAGLAIAMANLWSYLKIVGIDPWKPSVILAQENVQNAGLAERIQLREQAVEAFSDTDQFDLAWLPSAFIPEGVIFTACENVYRALRPGGWLLFAMANPGNDSVTASLVRLRTVFWGGSLMSPLQIETLLRETGFVDIRILPSPPDAVVALVAGRRM